MKKILLGAVASLTLSACDLDYFPNDSMTSDQMAGNPSSTEYSTDGNYSMFKDVLEYKGSEYSGSTYVRYFFQMSEFRGDNVCLANKTEDPLYNEICYNDLETDLPTSYFWWCAYHIIYGANAVIESQPEGASDEGDRMLGENYFLRAICHLHLSMLYSRPYTFGRDNMGVVLRTSTDTPATERSTVGAVYDQIRDDLVKAAGLLKDKARRGDAGYVSYDAAMGLLSRVYLYRGEDDKVIETVNGLLGGASAESKLDPDYFENALSSPETLWAVAHEDYEDRGRESVGSMYWTPDQRGVGGWAEMYYSDPLIALYERHPEDIRFTAYCERLNPDETGGRLGGNGFPRQSALRLLPRRQRLLLRGKRLPALFAGRTGVRPHAVLRDGRRREDARLRGREDRELQHLSCLHVQEIRQPDQRRPSAALVSRDAALGRGDSQPCRSLCQDRKRAGGAG